ncbi:MAG: hypothetical protein GY711_16980 [bacterium]|nr:hypothetical protein [bacterium]
MHRLRSRRTFAVSLFLLALSACGGGSSSAPVQVEEPPEGNTPGLIFEHPRSSATRSTHFIVDANHQGRADAVRIVDVLGGRLVDIYDEDEMGDQHLVHEDFVISPSLVSNGQDIVVEQHPVTGETRLVIRYPADSEPFRSAFRDGGQLTRADGALIRVTDFPFDASVLFSVVPRDAALVVQFDDLLDATTLSEATFVVLTGTPPEIPFEGRLRIDTNHGDLARLPGDTEQRFYTTRALFDPTVSELEALGADPPLALQASGFPAATLVDRANLMVRIPTRRVPLIGQTEILTNASGKGLAFNGNGSRDVGSQTRDVLRAMRAGGAPTDPDRGYLPDQTAPRLLGEFEAEILVAPQKLPGKGARFLLPQLALPAPCAKTPATGDLILQPGIIAEVLPYDGALSAGLVVDVPVRLLAHPLAWAAPEEWIPEAVGAATLRSAWDDAMDVGLEGCFLRLTPEPQFPGAGVSTSAVFGLLFNEAMAVEPFVELDAALLSRAPLALPGTASEELVPGEFATSLDQRELTFVPLLPLAHASGASESYFWSLLPGARGVQDLSGRLLAASLPAIELRLDPTGATQRTGGRVQRFTEIDEDPPFGGTAEWTGQHVYDLDARRLRPRPVIRFSGLADRTQPMAALMTPTAGVREPLTHFGARTQILWRHSDLDLDVANAADWNIDVEGLSWSPIDQVSVDTYDAFEMRLAHAAVSPDELLGGNGAPAFPASGLGGLYEPNELGEPRIVHDRLLGYDVQPGDEYPAPGGLRLVPFPWNRTTPSTEWTHYTWRDTAIQTRAANAASVPPQQWFFALGLPLPPVTFYSPGNAQSAGLPLLMDFRCYPDDPSSGRNLFDTSLAVPTTTGPFFRAFTAGGLDTSGTPVFVDPDLEAQANGGFDPTSLPFPGAPTAGRDAQFYVGAVDFVVRVSRSVSIWKPAIDPAGGVFSSPSYTGPLVATIEPAGTSIELAFRATGVVENDEAETDAGTLDAYGDHYAAPEPHDAALANLDELGVPFLTLGESSWRGVDEIGGRSYYQVRVTFRANPVTGDLPELAALGLGWSE